MAMSSKNARQDCAKKGPRCFPLIFSAQRERVVDVLVESGGKGRTPQFAEVCSTANARETQEPSFGRASVRAELATSCRRGLRVSEPKEKGKGLFGRLFKGGAAEPAVPEEAQTEAEVEAEVPASAAVPVSEEPPKAEPIKQSWFQRLKSGLGKTSSKLTSGITDLFSKRKLDADTSTILKIF